MKPLRSRILVLLAAAALSTGMVAGSAQASQFRSGEQPFCGQVWGSLPEARPLTTTADVVTDVRAGRHACFDRLVIDLGGSADRALSYDVRYVPGLSEQGSGADVPVRGGATLRVLVGAAAYDDHRKPTYLPDHGEVVDVSSFETFRHVAWAGSFEGQTSLGIGTRARLPFRVFTLSGEPGSDRPVRLVVDVGHLW